MKLQIGDPVVFRGRKYRTISFFEGGVLLKQRFGGKAAIVKPEDLAYDDVVGVWRASHGSR